jgi:hypothetical protein
MPQQAIQKLHLSLKKLQFFQDIDVMIIEKIVVVSSELLFMWNTTLMLLKRDNIFT